MMIGLLLIPIGVGLFMTPIGIVIYLYGLVKPLADLVWKNNELRRAVTEQYAPFVKAIKNFGLGK